ncbi:MAG: hypothetical protein RL885_06910 [Planctomycetota bacterium]
MPRRRPKKKKAPRAREHTQSPRATRPTAHASGLRQPQKIAEQVEEHLASGRVVEALSAAKVLFGAEPSPSSQELLVRTYAARISALLGANLPAEANALLLGVERDFPDQSHLLEVPRIGSWIRTGRLADVLAILREPDSTAERVRAAEEALRRWLIAPDEVAGCDALPEDHPLRQAAVAVDAAFTRVTTEPTPDEELTLSEVSRRSPLAPWKPLIRAIAAFYRNDDVAAQEFAAATPSDSAPYRLAGTLETLITHASPPSDSYAQNKLFEKVLGYRPRLLELFDEAESATETGNARVAGKAVPKLIEELGRSHRDLIPRVRQRCWFKAIDSEMSPPAAERMLGGPVVKDASFWRLLGNQRQHALSSDIDPREVAQTSAIFFEYLHHAIEEGSIAKGSIDEAAVLLEIVRICRQAGHAEETIDWKPPFTYFQFELAATGQSPKLRERLNRQRPSHLPPLAELYDQVASITHFREVYREWADFAAEARDQKREEQALSAWREQFPEDAEVLRRLAGLAEARGALKKAADLIAAARRIDALSSDLQRAQWRVVANFSFRHLKQKKAHLVAKDLESLGELRDLTKEPAKYFAIALRAMIAAVEHDTEALGAHFDELTRALDDALAAEGMLLEMARCSSIAANHLAPIRTGKPELARIQKAAVKICSLSRSLELPLGIPESWHRDLHAASNFEALSASDLRLLAEAADRQNDPQLVFSLAGAGLQTPSSVLAELVFLRAKWVSDWETERKIDLCRVAATLARRRGDEAFAALAMKEARDVLLEYPGFMLPRFEMLTEELEDDEIGALLEHEVQFGRPHFNATRRKRRRRWRALQFDFDEFDEFDDDLDDEFDFEDFFGDEGRARDHERGQRKSSGPPSKVDEMEAAMEALGSDPDLQRKLESASGIPASVLGLMMEAIEKYGEDLDYDQLERDDPELFGRIAAALGVGDVLPGQAQPKRRQKKNRRRR